MSLTSLTPSQITFAEARRTTMKLERAQELYSDYAEDTLTPALRLALEQHFDSDPAARADYEMFARVYALLEEPAASEVEVPLGFRSKILERAAAEQGHRETTFTTRSPRVGGWFQTISHRRATGGALAALAAVAAMAFVIFPHQGARTTNPGNMVPTPTQTISPEMLQSIETTPGQASGGHVFHLHLPETVPAATVNAYVITDTNQITDPAHLADATPAMKNMHLNNHQGVQIPIAPLEAQPAGSTLDLLVQWTPDDTTQPSGSEVVFTPFGAADPTPPAPANANFLDAVQAVAAHYGVTVVVEADTVPTQTVSPDFSGTDPAAPLIALAAAANLKVQALPSSNTFYLYDPAQEH